MSRGLLDERQSSSGASRFSRAVSIPRPPLQQMTEANSPGVSLFGGMWPSEIETMMQAKVAAAESEGTDSQSSLPSGDTISVHQSQLMVLGC